MKQDIWDRLNEFRTKLPLGYWFVYDAVVIAALLVPILWLRILALAFLGLAIFWDLVEVVWKRRNGT